MASLINPEVRVLPDARSLGLTAAAVFVDLAVKTLEHKGNFFVALSGGSTPDTMFEVVSCDYRDAVEWGKVDFFWVDERCVPMRHKDSNYGRAYDLMLSKIPCSAERIHRIRGEDNPQDESRRYENEIIKTLGVGGPPAFDLIFLGMGQDGHTASLFSESNALSELKRLAMPVYAGGRWRITLTLPVINNAGKVYFLVSGGSKAETLAEVLEDPEKSPDYPAGLVIPANGQVVWLIDKDASAKLSATGKKNT